MAVTRCGPQMSDTFFDQCWQTTFATHCDEPLSLATPGILAISKFDWLIAKIYCCNQCVVWTLPQQYPNGAVRRDFVFIKILLPLALRSWPDLNKTIRILFSVFVFHQQSEVQREFQVNVMIKFFSWFLAFVDQRVCQSFNQKFVA